MKLAKINEKLLELNDIRIAIDELSCMVFSIDSDARNEPLFDTSDDRNVTLEALLDCMIERLPIYSKYISEFRAAFDRTFLGIDRTGDKICSSNDDDDVEAEISKIDDCYIAFNLLSSAESDMTYILHHVSDEVDAADPDAIGYGKPSSLVAFLSNAESSIEGHIEIMKKSIVQLHEYLLLNDAG